MHIIRFNKIKQIALLFLAAFLIFTSCNKDLPEAVPLPTPKPGVGPSIGSLLSSDTNYAFLKAAVTKAGLLPLLKDTTSTFTLFAPNNNAFRTLLSAFGLPPIESSIDNLPTEQVAAIVSYLIVPQELASANIPESFPNLQYATILNPQPTNPAAALLRLTSFPSKRGSITWLNNIPIVKADTKASNGLIHDLPAVAIPPSQFLWDRIKADPTLTYLKAAIIRSDSLAIALNTTTLQNYLGDSVGIYVKGVAFGPNFTLFAPNDNAFKAILTNLIYKNLLAQVVPQPPTAMDSATQYATATYLASSPAVFSNPLLYGALTAQTVQGIIAYHTLGSRGFSVNLPTTPTNEPTLLNQVVITHPGVTLQATFSPFGTVTAATVKGLFNPTASNIQINPTPAPYGTSDQLYINGVLHIIDQV